LSILEPRQLDKGLDQPDPVASGVTHQRQRAGLNHLAFHVADHHQVDALVAEAPQHGWRLLFPDRHPYAGGDQHYAAYLEDTEGFEVELVAITAPGT
jgi:catechol 2,3-dioxygenase-like lactoylglutathione lyase family enzyme